MNFSNKLTIFRIVSVPFFLVSLLQKSYLMALFLFSLAVLTDFLDGKLARLKNEVTDFGKFLDPIADKVLTTSAYLYFIKINLLGIVPVFIILSREFVISAVRLLACKKGKVIAANFLGKLKTFFQVLSIILAILFLYLTINLRLQLDFLNLFFQFFVWTSVILSVISGFSYVKECFGFETSK